MDIFLQNTLTGEKEKFAPIKKGEVSMYNCGPTVYGIQHIGNLSMFVFTDILRKTLQYNNLEVKQVINITDFGHLSGDNIGDADTGEDRMSKGLRQEGLELTLANMRTMAEKYANLWKSDLRKLNINIDQITFPFASDYIPDQIQMIQKLEEKGFAYTGAEGVYFDTAKFPDYGRLGNINLAGLKPGARVESNMEKRNPTDFLLWKSDKNIGWESPWGKGFPGWHIECSAMIFKILGEQIDIHTGGIEHIGVHHNNEIAQSEAASGKKPFSRFWLHRAHLQINSSKIAKSEGNTIYLSEIIARGFSPLDFRYLLLTSHYRTSTNFTWEALEGARKARQHFKLVLKAVSEDSENEISSFTGKQKVPRPDQMQKRKDIFNQYINDDLDTPRALVFARQIVNDSELFLIEMRELILDFDKVLGLELDKVESFEIPENVQKLINERDLARNNKDFAKSDEIRKEIEDLGFEVKDTPEGTEVTPR